MPDLQSNWPITASYTGAKLERLALPIGGIGTGTVCLGGRGDLRDWELMNRPAKGLVPFFQGPPSTCVWWSGKKQGTGARILEGPLGHDGLNASEGADLATSQFPRFRGTKFHTTYPMARLELSDADVPLEVVLEAGNPFVPGDTEASSWPTADLCYHIKNTTSEPLDISVCCNIPNYIGCDGSKQEPDHYLRLKPVGAKSNRNEWREGDGMSGLFMNSMGVDPSDPAWGTMALTTTSTEAELHHRTTWQAGKWRRPLLDWWQDWTTDGRLRPRHDEVDSPMASLAIRRTLAPGEAVIFDFRLCWHFPNRLDWDYNNILGNYYTTRFADAWEVAQNAVTQIPNDFSRCHAFLRDISSGDLPQTFLEAALANASTLRTQTCFRPVDGRLAGWEGVHDLVGSCPGSCTHVWNYEHLSWQLFPDLALSMREAEFLDATDDEGRMAFRIQLPAHRNKTIKPESRLAAADGQLGCIVKAWREWRQNGQADWLQKMWPQVKRSIEFCWIKGGWDANADGIMDGCQHNTMDVEYFGPNPQMTGWYIVALQAGADMADAIGENDFAERCQQLAKKAIAFMEQKLFNGEYYEHHIEGCEVESIAPGLRAGLSDMNPLHPELQLGGGCLIDQLVGPVVAQMAGMTNPMDQEHLHKTTQSILKYNRREDFYNHFNPFRCYATGMDEAVLMCSYPNPETKPERPFPYYGEVMTGFEHTLALQLMQEGQFEEAERVVKAIRDRHDGARRNPFDEIECGHHYVRAMASWGYINARTGFVWDAITKTVTVNHGFGKSAWTVSGTWGLVHRNGDEAKVEALGPPLDIEKVVVRASASR